jgi:hypothetical protein
MQACQVRSLLYEFGVVASKNFRSLKDPTSGPVPELLGVELLNQLEELQNLRSASKARASDRWLAAS